MELSINHFSYDTEKIPKHENPSRSKIDLLKMGAVYFGIELLFSLEIALTVPILLESNVSKNIYSYVYFLSPVFGFIFQPILGAMSDRCQSPYGRRRPFIFALAIASYIGISLILKGGDLGLWFGDGYSKIPTYRIALTAIGVTILDFSADTCDSPLRAYLLDSCNSRDQHMALNLHAFLGGVGGALGYILSAVDWKNSYLSFLGDESQILFILTSIIFISCLYMTLTAAKEERYLGESNHDSVEVLKEVDNRKDGSFLKTLFKSFLNMPKELKRLFVCQTIGWLAFYSTTLFFTDYIAQNIYNGDPTANRDTSEYMMYEYGIKMGSWCLLTYSISSAVSAMVVENFLLERYSPRTLFLFTYFFYIFCCVTIYNLDNIISILPFCSCFGIMLTTLTTIPYQLLYEFHNDKAFVSNINNKLGTKRGFGIDCAILGSCHFLSQTIVSSFMSFLTSSYGNEVILLQMDSNKAKIEESNNKRLESLREKLNEYKNKKSLVRSSLNDLDSGVQKPKKIVFDDSDSDNEKKQPEMPKPKIVRKEPETKKKFKLINSGSDSESDSSDIAKENEEAFKMFESKINLDEKKANQLIYLKSKYSNDDSRFKIDDRFIEDEDSDKTKDSDSKKITKKQLKTENLNSLKILEEITGKQIIRPKSLQDKEDDLKRAKKNRLQTDNEINRNKMVRYDPTKDTHKVFELKKSDSEDEESSSDESIEINHKEETDSDEDKQSEQEIEENNEEEKKIEEPKDDEKFFKIEPNLKELFASNDVFKFKFTDDNEDFDNEDDETELQEEYSFKNDRKKNNFMKELGFDRFQKSNYSSSETESEEEGEEEEDRKQVEIRPKHTTNSLESNINENKSFLPNFEQDSHLKDALSYFCRPKDIDLENLRKDWLTTRETLVKECKKKHKKMVRIKRTKENENLLPWMKKSNSDSFQNKRRKK
ncbi:unnamed protein product [Brachionus calyciflorus]|uniref:Uncharacterized protein n=1 Tax=Brachionus calyciflorus TaxID=104777 RepID=A0A813M5U8_9BILA|nr:unnamed protein product [Brachionus calyciflorus]